MISQAIQENSDLCRGQYAVSPSNEVIIEELPNESEPVSEISNSAKEIVKGMGYWRFLYSRRHLSINKVIFIPAFADLKSKFFILDDVFFLFLWPRQKENFRLARHVNRYISITQLPTMLLRGDVFRNKHRFFPRHLCYVLVIFRVKRILTVIWLMN